MKSQRLLEILLRLQARSPRSARELAQALNVTQRTIYRYVESLSAAGVPVFTIRGSQGGIGLVEGYRRAISNLVEQEIRALFTSGSDPLLDLGFGDQLAAAREKLFGALSQTQRLYAVKVRERIRIEQKPWGQGDQPLEVLPMLRLALWEERIARVEYRNQTGQVAHRSLHPLALVFKAGVWYCVAQQGTKVSTYRAARILSIDVLPTRFKRPVDFRLDEYWQQNQARYESKAVPCTVRVRGMLKDLEQLAVFWPARIDSPDNESSLPCAEIQFQLHGQAVHELLAWSSSVEVVSPPAIREEIVQRLESALGRYKNASGRTARAARAIK